MKENIVLIGMPGAGKSTIGVLLAKAINYQFIDTDLIIQNRTNMKLFELINKTGINTFLKIEEDILSELTYKKTVIATGGSAVYGEKAMKHLSENGHIIYIKLSCEEIKKRVNNIKTRGIAMSNGSSIEDVYEERIALYDKYADIIVDCENMNIEESVNKIMMEINNL